MKIVLKESTNINQIQTLEFFLEDNDLIYERDGLNIFFPFYNKLILSIKNTFKFIERIEDGVVKIDEKLSIGGEKIVLMAGPCAVEKYDQLEEIASFIKDNKVSVLRGGAYKPRTSPHSFQGLKEEGLDILKQIGKKYELPIISEVMGIDKLDDFVKSVDIIQIGARNMQNFELLKAVGKTNKPVLLKRGFGNTIEELLYSAEYITNAGNHKVILCERGIRTFEHSTRYTLDLSVITSIKVRCNFPVVVDPSHAMGDYKLIEPMALAAIAAGADGLLIEVHNHPKEALCDKEQALKLNKFKKMIEKCQRIAIAINKTI